MTKLIASVILICSTILACGQSKTHKKAVSMQDASLSYDTSRMVILTIDTLHSWIFKDGAAAQLTNQDVQQVNKLLQKCINLHNSRQDTTKEFSEYIDLKKYKLQFVPFIDKKGHKKVYVSSFCFDDSDLKDFDYWKQSLVEVLDGGSCFFHLTIDLTKNSCERLYTNGYA